MTAFGISPRRIARTFTSILLGWNVAGAALAAAPVIDAIDWNRADVDLSFLNRGERPAVKRGFVHSRGDMLVFGDATQARFWGINIAAATLFATDHAAVKAHSHRLSQLGFNLVRLHHHDSHWVQPNVFGAGPVHDTHSLDPAMLEKIDWWIKCLKDEGI